MNGQREWNGSELIFTSDECLNLTANVSKTLALIYMLPTKLTKTSESPPCGLQGIYKNKTMH